MFDLPNTLLNDPFEKCNQQDLLPLFLSLTKDHAEACPAYKKIINAAFPAYEEAQNLTDLPFIPVSLFKHRALSSAAHQDIRFNIQSSGTTGLQKSQVALTREGAQLSSRALASILRSLIGPSRKPMLFIDTASTLKSRKNIGARSAAILGLMPFGFDHTFVLDDDLNLDREKLADFLSKHNGKEFLIYGFTSLVWESLLPFCEEDNVDFKKGTLLHSGGWKHLADKKISNEIFKNRLKTATNIKSITNFYGMAEMPGVIFPENEAGSLKVPNFSSVLIRDPHSKEVLPDGQEGLVQIFNPLAHSYPGHSLLTEDIGIIEKCGLRILGRAPKSELRGCSDVLAAT